MDSKHVPIFVINLNGFTDRLERISRRLNRLGLDFERIPAVNGRSLSREEKQKISSGRSRPSLSDSEIAHYMSHLKALRSRIADFLARSSWKMTQSSTTISPYGPATNARFLPTWKS